MNGLCGLRDDSRVRPKDPEPVEAFGKGYLSQGIAFLAHEDTVAPGAHAALTAHGWARTHVIVEKSTSTASSFAAGTPAQQAFAHGLVQYAFSPKVALSDVYGASILGFQLRWNHNVEQLLGTVNPLLTLGRRRLVEDANPSPGVFSALELVPREGLPRDGACGCPTSVELVGTVRVADAAAGKACLVEKPRAAYPVDKHGAAHWQVQSPSLCGAYARWASKCKLFSGSGSEAPERFSELSGAASRDAFTAASDQSDAMLEASADDFSDSNEPNSPTQARKVELEAAGRGLWGEAFEDMPLRHAVQEAKDLRSSISVADAAFSGWKDAQLSTSSTNNPSVDDDVFEGLLEDDDIFEGVPGLPSRRALAEEALRRQVVRNNARNLGLFDWMLGPGDANQPSYTTEDEFAPGETAFEFTTDPHEVNGDQPNAAASTGSAAQPGPFDADFDAAATGPPGGAHYPFDPNQPPQWLAAQGGGWLFGTPDGFDAQDAPAQSSREGSGTADWGFYDYDQAFGTFYSADDGSFFANSFWGVSYTSTQSGAAGQNGNNNCAQTGTGSDPNDPLGDPLFQDDAFAPSDDLYVPNGPQCSPAAGSTGGGSQGGPDRTLPGGGSNGGCPSQYEYKDPQTDTCECVTGYFRQSPTSACEPFQNNRQRPVKDHDPRGVLGVDEVHPEVKRLALRTATLLQNEGYDPYVFEAYRSWARQDQLYNQGGVTQARAGQSWHNYGLAIDLIFYASNGRDPSWAESHPWDRVGALGKQAGFTVWGGDWTSFKDRPHLEYHPGFTGRSRDLIPVYNGQTGSILSKLQAVWTHLSIGVSGSGTTSPSSPPSASTPPAASASSTPAVTPSSTTVANTNHPAFDPRGKLDDPLVHPDVRRMAIETVLDLQAEGYSPYVFECYRSHADQNAAYQRGNSKVTAGGSWHNYGLACDIIFYNSATGRPDWDNGHPWARLGAVGKANGFTEWGGDWQSFFDGPHLQYHPGHRNRARDLQPAYDAAAGNGIEAGIKAAWTFLGVGVDGTAAPSSSPAARRPSPSRTPTSTPAPSSSSTSAPSTTPSPSATPDPSSNSGTTTTGSATCSQGGAASQGLAAYNEDDAKNVRDLCAGRGNNCHSGGCGASTDLSLFSLNDAGLQLILEEEGEAGIFYYGGVKHHCPFIGAADHPWVVTQGYGNVIYHGRGQGDVAEAQQIRDSCRSAECCWTDAEARANLRRHVQDRSEATVRRFFSGRTLNANQFSALVSGFYNVGSFAGPGTDSGWPFRSDNYKYVCRGTFNLFVKASGCIARGLVRRRIRECVLFWTPVDEAVNLPNRDTIGARLDPRLPPGQGYPERLTKYYGKGSPC
ncbi:ply [Symbiodinium sp. KB8]|nr:ply [Symbiodinium sp. KB8]